MISTLVFLCLVVHIFKLFREQALILCSRTAVSKEKLKSYTQFTQKIYNFSISFTCYMELNYLIIMFLISGNLVLYICFSVDLILWKKPIPYLFFLSVCYYRICESHTLWLPPVVVIVIRRKPALWILLTIMCTLLLPQGD